MKKAQLGSTKISKSNKPIKSNAMKSVRELGDFKPYFCNRTKRNYWLLGYFGGGAITFGNFKIAASEYSKETGAPIDFVGIEEILTSRRFKGVKVVYSTDANKQEPINGASIVENAWAWFHD